MLGGKKINRDNIETCRGDAEAMSHIIVNKEWCKGCELLYCSMSKKIIALEEGFKYPGLPPCKLIDANQMHSNT